MCRFLPCFLMSFTFHYPGQKGIPPGRNPCKHACLTLRRSGSSPAIKSWSAWSGCVVLSSRMLARCLRSNSSLLALS